MHGSIEGRGPRVSNRRGSPVFRNQAEALAARRNERKTDARGRSADRKTGKTLLVQVSAFGRWECRHGAS